ncbi:hypothetical protein N0V84_012454 [Fusarium piperis]|uniref:Uncharacterized protein n=1 Tax=Fusarium piperis TaxID=1435070 RepID=A0A9W8TBF5_9HYPO|nr:hypothetical protein N0V84_012454 [Fusarium piperis]
MSPSPTEREDTPEVANSPADTIMVDSEADRLSSYTVEAPSDGPSDPEWREATSPMLHATWTSTTTVMAKCDFCQLGSRGTLQQCRECGVSICEECFEAGRLDRRHQLDADHIDWNQHNKSGRRSKKRVSRARQSAACSSAVISTPSTPEQQSSARDNHRGNNGYASIQPHFSSSTEQPLGRYNQDLDGSSNYHGGALTSGENLNVWNAMFDQSQTGPSYDHMQFPQNGFGSSYSDGYHQPIQFSSAYGANQSAYHHHPEPAANPPVPAHQTSYSTWQQPQDPPNTSALRSPLYHSDLSNYNLVSISVAPGSFIRSTNRSQARSTPRILPELRRPYSSPPRTLQHAPAGPPRQYEDYLHPRQAGAVSPQGQGADQSANAHLAYHLPSIRMTTEEGEDDGHDADNPRQDL